MASYGVSVTPIAAAGAATIDARNAVAVVVRAGAGATVTASAVDDITASAHTSGTENEIAIAAGEVKNLFVELGPWPAFRVSSAGGDCRVGVIT